jgi:hypothetical protein
MRHLVLFEAAELQKLVVSRRNTRVQFAATPIVSVDFTKSPSVPWGAAAL